MQTPSQSWTERILNRIRLSSDRDVEMIPEEFRPAGRALAVGCLLGLLVGLFVGWVVWPVQWSDTQTMHLEPDAKAHYIAAVADAYVSAGADQAASELAVVRLRGLSAADMATAQAYFQNALSGSAAPPEFVQSDQIYRQFERTDSNLRLNNLNRLANDLNWATGVASSSDAVSAPAIQDNAVQIDQASESANGTSTESQSSTSNQSLSDTGSESATGAGLSNPIFGRVVACLTALMLVLGGVYILVRLNQQMNWVRRGAGRPAHNAVVNSPQSGGDRHAGFYGGQEPVMSPDQPVSGFDDDDDGWGPSTAYGQYHTDSTAESNIVSAQPSPFTDSDSDDEYAAYRDRNDRTTDIGPAMMSVSSRAMDADDVSQRRHEETAPYSQPFSRSTSSYEANRARSVGDEVETLTGAAGGDFTSQSARTRPVPPRTARAKGVLLDFTAEYKRGEIANYDESHQIYVDVDERGNLGRNVGECGMGINIKNGILLNNPHDVIAMDVWLVDKTDPESLGSIKRILLSEYAIDQDLSSVIQREDSSDGAPLVPQTGLEFKLDGNTLTLVCHVLEATYLREPEESAGIFDQLKVQMTVYSEI